MQVAHRGGTALVDADGEALRGILRRSWAAA
jgi:hypothetical protein